MIGDPIGCEGKKAFSSYREADFATKKMNSHGDGRRLNPYKCNSCLRYHVGNSKGEKWDGTRIETTRHYSESSEEFGLFRDGDIADEWYS